VQTDLERKGFIFFLFLFPFSPMVLCLLPLGSELPLGDTSCYCPSAFVGW
jgi:hypothetical protein